MLEGKDWGGANDCCALAEFPKNGVAGLNPDAIDSGFGRVGESCVFVDGVIEALTVLELGRPRFAALLSDISAIPAAS